MNNKNKRQKNLISCGKKNKKKKLLCYMTNAHRVMHDDHLFFFCFN